MTESDNREYLNKIDADCLKAALLAEADGRVICTAEDWKKVDEGKQ